MRHVTVRRSISLPVNVGIRLVLAMVVLALMVGNSSAATESFTMRVEGMS